MATFLGKPGLAGCLHYNLTTDFGAKFYRITQNSLNMSQCKNNDFITRSNLIVLQTVSNPSVDYLHYVYV